MYVYMSECIQLMHITPQIDFIGLLKEKRQNFFNSKLDSINFQILYLYVNRKRKAKLEHVSASGSQRKKYRKKVHLQWSMKIKIFPIKMVNDGK